MDIDTLLNHVNLCLDFFLISLFLISRYLLFIIIIVQDKNVTYIIYLFIKKNFKKNVAYI